MMMAERKLTPKQELFVAEFLVDLNATQAAIRAGYSAKTAAVMGYENLRKPNIAIALAEAKVERLEQVKADAAWALKELLRLHKTGMSRFLNPERTGFDLANATEEDIDCLSSLKIKTRTILGGEGERDVRVDEITVGLVDRLKLLQQIGLHIDVRAWSEQREVTGALGITDGRPVVDVNSPDADWIEAARRVAFMLATAARMEKKAAAKTIEGKTE